jgi:hypothetical protein
MRPCCVVRTSSVVQDNLVIDFDGMEDALTSNTAYGNIHTTKLPAGESAARSVLSRTTKILAE